MSVRKSCYNCEYYEKGGICTRANLCSDDMTYWVLSDDAKTDLLHDAKTVPIVNENTEPEHDSVNHPNHYTQGEIECIDALKSATTGLQGIEAVCTANAIKYLWRWKHKNGAQDIDKAIWYLNRLKKELEV